jgi:hypothetical protein
MANKMTTVGCGRVRDHRYRGSKEFDEMIKSSPLGAWVRQNGAKDCYRGGGKPSTRECKSNSVYMRSAKIQLIAKTDACENATQKGVPFFGDGYIKKQRVRYQLARSVYRKQPAVGGNKEKEHASIYNQAALPLAMIG